MAERTVYNSACGCVVFRIMHSNPNLYRIQYCPLHKSAPKMYEALEQVRQDINWMLNNQQFLNPDRFEYIDKALAEGKEV